MNKRFLILGSAGQIGTHLTDYLIERDYQVDTFDIEDSIDQDLRIQNNEILDCKIENSDFVFFLAFDVGGSRYLNKYQHTYEFIDNNMKIMTNTFQILKKYNKPFLFTSTQMSNMVHSPYGLLKLMGEKMTLSLDGLFVKLWNVYGVERDMEKSHVITDFILKAQTTNIIDMISDGSELRQFLYANDCCDCLLTLSNLYSELSRDEEYHISSFEWNSIMEIAEIVSSKINSSKIIAANSKDLVQKDMKNEPNTYILKYWQPQTSIEEGIQKIIEEMK
jgi:nucleoside-diphosphate-sugar epimerase